jgi:hypothetical protein
MNQQHEYDHTFADFAAAQLVEQLRSTKTSESCTRTTSATLAPGSIANCTI